MVGTTSIIKFLQSEQQSVCTFNTYVILWQSLWHHCYFSCILCEWFTGCL